MTIRAPGHAEHTPRGRPRSKSVHSPEPLFDPSIHLIRCSIRQFPESVVPAFLPRSSASFSIAS